MGRGMRGVGVGGRGVGCGVWGLGVWVPLCESGGASSCVTTLSEGVGPDTARLGRGVCGIGVGIQGLGFRVWGLGFGEGLWFRVWGSGFRVQGSGFGVQGLECHLWRTATVRVVTADTIPPPVPCKRDWYVIAEQPAPAPHLTSGRMCCPAHCASHCALCQPLLRAFSG